MPVLPFSPGQTEIGGRHETPIAESHAGARERPLTGSKLSRPRAIASSGTPAASAQAQAASELRTLDAAGDRNVQEGLRRQSEDEADRLVAAYRALPPGRNPRLWFTYHVYYKAPDWIGPRVADALAIPAARRHDIEAALTAD